VSEAGGADLSRRRFLVRSGLAGTGLAASGLAGSGLLIGLRLADGKDAPPGDPFAPNAYVRIAPDDAITVTIGKSEMGQGIYTSIPMCIAEELDVDPSRVKVEFAPVDKAFFAPGFPAQFTGGSTSTRLTFTQMRFAGAAARFWILAAAAEAWSVAPATLSTSNGVVTDGARHATYGSLATRAAKLAEGSPPLPLLKLGEKPPLPLKDPKDFRYIGKPQRRLDGLDKVTGRAVYGLDVREPGMLIAVIARSPVFGGRVRHFRDTATRRIKGVVDVRQVPSGVAVLATNTWAARRGCAALEIDWDDQGNGGVSSAAISARYRELAQTPGIEAKESGQTLEVLSRAARSIDVTYEVPYLAHACMEPLNAYAHVTAEHAELRVGTQNQSQDAELVAAAVGLKPDQVAIHTTFLGGGFGRRSNYFSDFSVEAAEVSKAAGRPVKVVWTREDDMRGGFYRPLWVSRFRGAVDERGIPSAWQHIVVGQSVYANSAVAKFAIKNGIDPSSVEGSVDMPYRIPHHRVELHTTENSVPVLFWRSVGNSHTGFVINSFLDELAHLGGQDPYELRRALLKDAPEHLRLLDLVAGKAGWGKPLPDGHAQGIAYHESFGTRVAQVAEVSVLDGKLRVHRVVCGVDPGIVVNPLMVEAQMQSAIVYGLSAALHGEITVENGRTVQGNFNDYEVLRLDEMPVVEVVIAPNGGPVGGVGEAGLPPVAAAVCNAIFAATGKRIRKLPILPNLQSA
jgi:isoquinoline 1-oxidoreductase beta subunit